ncbi:MAG: GNAT family N-acetyltransferase [Candidatus Velthaea sp.]
MGEITVETVRTATDELRELIDELDRTLAAEYLPEQRHGVSLDALFQPHVRFFLARLDGLAVGCGGVALFATFGEVKRMSVRDRARGRGIARALLSRIESETKNTGLHVLRLETGARQRSALQLYERAGFRACDAFADYASMPPHAIATSVFLEKHLTGQLPTR